MENTVHWLAPLAPQAESPAQHVETGTNGRLALHTPMHDRLLAIKNEIDQIAPDGQWDDAKKITNPYEYIFLSLQRRMHKSVSAITPLSRSYFKMIEMWDQLGIDPATVSATVHSAEGPGGFLEAIQDRIGTAKQTPMIAMTLRSTERSVPGWRKSHAFLQKYPCVKITYGADNTGNLYHLANQDAFTAEAATWAPNATIYTADGGFDFSADFNGQENTVQRLLVAELLAGLTTLAKTPDSTMIIKLFDMKHRATLDIMWAVSTCFERTALIKPHTSRPANSERYWVARGYRGAPAWLLSLFRTLTATNAPTGWNQLFADAANVGAGDWVTSVQQFQEELEQHQFNKIQLTLNIIKTTTREQILELLLENIRNSRTWCSAHNVPLNRLYNGLSDEQVAASNLEEALVPFQASVARTNLQGLSRRSLTHHASSAAPSLLPPAGRAWRTALPASVLGRAPSQTVADTPPSTAPTPSQFRLGSDHEPEPL